MPTPAPTLSSPPVARERPGPTRDAPPLVVDLDGTLTPTDTLLESLVILVKRRPFAVLWALWALRGGRDAFKQRIAAETRLPVHLLPWRADFVAWLREQRATGRRLILATAAHESIAAEVARELELFDTVIATNTKEGNLKGAAKLAAIRARVGDRFSYAGDERADLPIWASATSAVVVGAREGVARRVRAAVTVEREFPPAAPSPGFWLRALRAHQWVKNLLLFVPLLTSFSFLDPGSVLAALVAFAAFSLAASGTYLLNDVWDLDSDRQHARKRYRPVASGALKLSHALGAAARLAGRRPAHCAGHVAGLRSGRDRLHRINHGV